MKTWTTLLLVALALPGALTGQEPLTLATWNIGLIDRGVDALDLKGFAAEVDPDILVLNEVKSLDDLDRLRQALGRPDDALALSSFDRGDDNLEVGILSRFPLSDIVEFDPFPEAEQTSPAQRPLERPDLRGLAAVGTSRGFLVARVAEHDLVVIATHLKSSRGRSGSRDLANAQKRELVAAAIAVHVNELRAASPTTTVFVAGDFNVGVTDAAKNGVDLEVDAFGGSADLYDETHALLARGLVGGLQMRSLADEVGETFVGDDDVPDFVGSGAIDVIYAAGPCARTFAEGRRASRSFGSDHRAVFTTSPGCGAPEKPEKPAKRE